MALDRTYHVDVDDIGTFTFRRRVIRDQIRIEAEAFRILGGPIDDADLHHIALAMATLSTLTVTAPKGWNVEELDPLERSETAKLWSVYGGLRAAEEKFRSSNET